MSKPQVWILMAIVAIVVIAGVGWVAFNKPGDGSTSVVAPAAPDAATALQPVPGEAPQTAGGTPGQAPAVDATGAAVIQ
jgi:hypothetical protein